MIAELWSFWIAAVADICAERPNMINASNQLVNSTSVLHDCMHCGHTVRRNQHDMMGPCTLNHLLTNCRFWFLNDWKNNIVEMLIALEHTDEKFAR